MAAELSPPQQEAVQTVSGPMLVLAGAGSGKTRVVTYRIAELIRRGTKPSRILAVTFTNKAASEMRERTASLLGKKLPEQPEISTFHSLCVRILRRHIKVLGYPEQFSICDRSDQEGYARQALREMNVPGESMRPSQLLYFISSWKSRGIRAEQAENHIDSDKEHLAALAFRRYQDAIRTVGAVDFDDLLLLVGELFERFPEIRRAEAGRFDQVMIDEYQDTNGTQYQIVKALASPHRNLCVVGDDDQAIYGWRGAEVSHILRFKIDWPEAKVICLEDNYRSTPEILQMANTLIANNLTRHDKVLLPARASGPVPRVLQLQDETEEAAQVVRDIRLMIEENRVNPRDIAILFRTNEQPRTFEMELRRVNVPYVLIGGMSFYDRKEVRDILAYLKVLANPQDEVSLLRIINVPARGIGKPAVKKLMAEAVAHGDPLWEILSNPASMAGLSSTAMNAIVRFRKLIDHTKERLEKGGLVDVIKSLINEIDYQGEIKRLYKEPNDQENRYAAVEEVLNALGSYEQRKSKKKRTIKNFLDEIALNGREDEKDKESKLDRDAIALMTLHSAKGLEFPHVYMVGMEEGLLPHHRAVAAEGDAIDEERRLCYVGITRAQNRLTISMALARQKWGKIRQSQPSRFLYELTGQGDHPNAQKIARKEEVTPGPKGSVGGKRAKPKGARGSRTRKASK